MDSRGQEQLPNCLLVCGCLLECHEVKFEHALQATRRHFTPGSDDQLIQLLPSPFLPSFSFFNFSHIVLLTFSLLHTPTDRSRGYLELSGSGSKEELQAGSYTGRPDSCAGKSRQLVCVEDINNVEQHARGNKEGRVEADSVLGNAGMESSKLFVGL